MTEFVKESLNDILWELNIQITSPLGHHSDCLE